ncbi:serum amyloid P-component-like [Xiphophorus hellerii]|uniref:serum amyloid P-component-like n=1 Tax=Xiphophorus hellerii TaxID=8084 RepID=UPI0013B3E6C9|nr:serum amyloid P-component-like [Xiphophorus hellerii]XP_032413913.1 serum amyloid P-component-like [Xiphophorus hellerii]
MMKLLLLVGMLTACAAVNQDLSGKMFTFPLQTNTTHVKLKTTKQDFNAVTVCQRSFTDLQRTHVLFSLAVPTFANGFMVLWDGSGKDLVIFTQDKFAVFGKTDYKQNTWHSICTTWDSASGLVQLWLDGLPSVRKFTSSGSNIRGSLIIMLGQEQDSHGGGFDMKQSFVGMLSDVHMWDYVLSACEIQKYVNEQNFTPGNVLNWAALDYQIVEKVVVENKGLFLNC